MVYGRGLDTFCPFLRDFVPIPIYDLFGIHFFVARKFKGYEINLLLVGTLL